MQDKRKREVNTLRKLQVKIWQSHFSHQKRGTAPFKKTKGNNMLGLCPNTVLPLVECV